MTPPLDPKQELLDHLPAMRAFAISLTHNATLADDLVHDAVVKAWSNLDSFEIGTNMRAWLFTILRNTFYSDTRRRAREVPDSDGFFAEGLATKPDHDGRLQLRDFREAFATLPVTQREALILVGVMGFTYAEAAKTCETAPGTIKSRVNRGRKRLAELLFFTDDQPTELTDKNVFSVVNAQPDPIK